MTPSANQTRTVVVLAGVLSLATLISAIAQLVAFWPGIMIWDAIRQYGQALTGQYDDWHPPAMNWLWRQFLSIHDGPAPMLLLQVILYWMGFALLTGAALRRGRGILAIALTACALLPIPIVLIGSILKDSLMAGALLVATGLLAWQPKGGAWNRGVAMAMLLAAATLRFNAVPACLPIFVALMPEPWRRSPVRLLSSTLIALVPLLAAMPVANGLLDAKRSGVELSLIIYDLGGITRYSGIDAFPPLPVARPVAVNMRCYDATSWDRYAWWGDDPCPIGFDSMRTELRQTDTSAASLWLQAVRAHPIAYAAHRLHHFDSNTRFLVHDSDEPPLSLQTDPNPWGFHVTPNRWLTGIGDIAARSLSTPLGWPIWWLSIGTALLILGQGFGGPSIALPVLLSALLYGFSYLPLSVASEIRYHLWTMTGIAIATMLSIDEMVGNGSPVRRRFVVAMFPPVAVTILCLTARLASPA